MQIIKLNRKKENKEELREILDKFKSVFIKIGILSFFINLLALLAPIYMLAVYDIVMPSKKIDTLIVVTIIILALFIFWGILEFIRNKIMVIISNKLDVMINKRIYNATFDMALKYPGKGTIEPITDLNTIKNFLGGPGLLALFDAPWFPIYLGIMFVFSPVYGIYGIVATLIIIALTLINNLVTKRYLEKSIEHQRIANNHLNNQLKNAEVVEAMGMRNALYSKWANLYGKFLFNYIESGKKSALYTNFSKSFRTMSSSLMYGVGAFLAIRGDISPGMIIAGAVLMGRALMPITQLIATWKQLIAAKKSYMKLNELLNEFKEPQRKISLPTPKGKLEFINVVTLPPLSNKPVLKNINLTIEAGDVVGVIGPSGAGKSSFVRTALGIWKAVSGEVRLDGAEISQYNRDEIGKFIGYLPQDIELFDGTIAENIARFEKFKDEDVIEAAKLAGVHEMILKFEDGYNTKIGPGGFALSGGQRQRIALARALYKKPKLIILDEPNSNLDDAGEEALKQAIIKLKELGSTIIFVTHKIPILNLADKILLLKDGMVSMYGPKNAVFQKLKG